jgi:hypothetical protein
VPTFAYRWKRKGGKKQGKAILAKCDKLSGSAKHFGKVDFLIWLSTDHCRDLDISQEQYTAIVYHELLHADVEIDEETGNEKPVIRGHDVEEFGQVIRDYGRWKHDLEVFADLCQQAPLFDTDRLRSAA